MRRFVSAGLVTLTAAVALDASLAPAAPQTTAIVATLHGFAKKYAVPGYQFAADAGGSTVHETGGYGDVAAKRPVAAGDVFSIESCSKPITAMAAMKLVDLGKISLDTKVFPFLGLSNSKDPRFAQITVRELMNHSADLEDTIALRTDDPMDVAKAAIDSKLLTGPLGHKSVYSNLGFVVLGAVIEKASGERYVDYVKQVVFGPAGVEDAAVVDGSAPIANRVKQYDKKGNETTNPMTPAGAPGGGWVMSATDLVNILKAYDAGRIVSASSKAAMLAPPVPPLRLRSNHAGYGLGWDVVYRDPKGGITYGKNGGGEGVFSWMEHASTGANFAVLYNGGTSGGDAQWGVMKPIEKALAK